MVSFKIGAGAGTLMALASFAAAPPLAALTMKECSAQYKDAQGSGTLGGMTWQEFRKARCGPTPGRSAYVPGVVFPKAVSPKYGQESPGKARMLTCLDQYKANKASNANAGLKWIEKGGGYYSECNKQLKG
jgi:hypothetical protein